MTDIDKPIEGNKKSIGFFVKYVCSMSEDVNVIMIDIYWLVH
jgi:hypothetical protein